MNFVRGINTRAAPDYTLISADDDTLSVTKIQSLRDISLIAYLNSHGIPKKLAAKYLKEIVVYNNFAKEYFVTLGMLNEDEGFELENKYFRGCYLANDISFIRGRIPKPDKIHMFHTVKDFLSAVFYEKDYMFECDAIILHSLENAEKVKPYIYDYGYRTVCTWMDNSEVGSIAQNSLNECFKSEQDLLHKPMNRFYWPYKNVNKWHINKVKLKPQVE